MIKRFDLAKREISICDKRDMDAMYASAIGPLVTPDCQSEH